jgi:hypothetical protein
MAKSTSNKDSKGRNSSARSNNIPRKLPKELSVELHPAAELIKRWLDGDELEQKRSLDLIKRALNENGLSDRRRFAE